MQKVEPFPMKLEKSSEISHETRVSYDPKLYEGSNLSIPSNLAKIKKRRSYWFYIARSTLKRVVDLGQKNLKLGGVIYCYVQWRSSQANKYIRLIRRDEILFIKQYCRFDPDYRSLLRKRMGMLDFMIWDLKIELTLDPKKFFNVWDEFRFMGKAWNKLRSWLYRRYGRFEYFWCREIHESGRPHLHILISGIHWISQAELSDVWQKYGGGHRVWVRRIQNRDSIKASRYAMKYLNKALDPKDPKYPALLFASNTRMFGMSRGCQNMVNVFKVKKDPQGFEYAGSILKSSLEVYCRETGIKLVDIIKIKLMSYQQIRDFPEIFECWGYDPP